MSGRKNQFKQLIDRCEAVGWSVRRTGKSHFFIKASDGAAESFPSTPAAGYSRGFKNAEAWCSRHGLLDAEARIAEEKESERMRRLNNSNTIADIATIKEGSNRITNENFVNGVKIVERNQAKFQTPITRGVAVPFKNITEILLEDSSVQYQCDVCYWTSPNGMAVRSHLSKHRLKVKDQPEQSTKVKKDKSKSGFIALAISVKVEIDEVSKRLEEVNKNLAELINDLATVEADPKTIEKAKKFDQLQTLMK
jgi:hypothetical protein